VPVGDLALRSPEQKSGKQPAGEGEQPEPAPWRWLKVGKVWDFPHDGGATIKFGKTQIAVFNFASRGEWYATQNLCPHRRELVLSRGMIGDQNGVPKVACPVHKKTFSLESGQCLGTESYSLQVFPVKVEGDDVHLQLPSMEELDAVLATEKTCNGTCTPPAPPPAGLKKSRAARKKKVVDPDTENPFALETL
jgi:nitrite reductase (NADH) large subunit